MNRVHPDLAELGPELRKLVQALLDGIDPAVRTAAMLASSGEPGKCQQVWCPVCALVALVTGEEHPLLTVVAEHSVSLMTVIRSVLSESRETPGPNPPPDDPPVGSTDDSSGAGAKSGYQPIPVSIEQ